MTPVQAIVSGEDGVRGFLHTPATSAEYGVVLTHGAGANCNAPLLVRAAEILCSAGAGDAAMRSAVSPEARPFGPPSPAAAAQDREGLRAAAAYLRKHVAGDVILGGHSYGGRQATMLAAEDPTVCQALLLFSYPLHPPGKPEKPRTAHFSSLRTPAFFISGSKDEFGSPEEMRSALRMIPARTEIVIAEGAGHDLKRAGFDLEGTLRRFLNEFAGEPEKIA